MNRAPSISVVIPAFNAARFLGATLDSLRGQTCQNWECVIVDDGSQDETAAVARRQVDADARLRLVEQDNRGTSAARNRGYAATHPGSEFVIFMDGDDLWLPDALETLREELGKHPQAVGVHGLARVVDERGEPLPNEECLRFGRCRLGLRNGRIIPWPEHLATRFETLLWSNHVYPPGLLLVRRPCYEQTGLFDPSLRLIEDWDMVVRLSRHGEIRFLDRVVLHYRRHAGNTSAADDGANVVVARLMHHRNFFSAENDAQQRQIVRQGWRAWQVFLLRESLRTLRRDFRRGRFAAAARTLARLYVPIHRCLRGYPTLRGL